MRLSSVVQLIWRSVYHLLSSVRRGWARLTSFRGVRAKFRRAHGYPLDLDEPRTFNERIVWRKLFVRDPLLVQVSDKILVRDYVREVLGPADGEQVLIPLLAVADDPADLPFARLTPPYIVKTNHGRGSHWVVRDAEAVDRRAIARAMRLQLRRVFGSKNHEWAYSRVRPRVLVERLLTEPDGRLPADFKFHMVRGSCLFIQVDHDRGGEHARSIYTGEWEPLPIQLTEIPQGPVEAAPEGLARMLDLSRRLSVAFEYVRVDLYWVEGRPWFGELTNYPGSGHGRFEPVSFDAEFGRRWGELAGRNSSAGMPPAP